MLYKYVFLSYFNLVLFLVVFYLFPSLILYVLFQRKNRRVSRNVWMIHEDDTGGS
jgi:hypothetical protein